MSKWNLSLKEVLESQYMDTEQKQFEQSMNNDIRTLWTKTERLNLVSHDFWVPAIHHEQFQWYLSCSISS